MPAGRPRVSTDQSWRFRCSGMIGKGFEWTWEQFSRLPRTRVFADFHCVTRWSRLGNLWEGVSTREIIHHAGGVHPEARYVMVYGHDRGWSTNLPLQDFLGEDCLVATMHDGEPLTVEHGGPARLIVPRLYAWKSAKWISGIELMREDRLGFWEANGYHRRGDPWQEERYG